MNTLKPGAIKFLKIFLIVLVLGGGFLYKTQVYDKREIDVSKEIQTVGEVAIPDAPEASLSKNATKLPFPSESVSANGGTRLTHIMMAWSSQNSWVYCNGGAKTTKNSLFDKYKLNIELKRQDDCAQSIAEFIKFCNDYKSDPSIPGVCVTYMGSGIPSYATTALNTLKELGPEYAPIIFESSGASAGEDQLIGDPAIKNNPQLLRGQVVIGVKLDGDMDIVMKYCNDNNVPFNPNPKYYDPNACNAAYPSNGSFVESSLKYNAGTLEKRIIVRNGKTTGKDTSVAPTMVTTWFPADRIAIEGKGGCTIISTKEYASMMPNITIYCKKWVNDHRTDCENLVMALAQGGDQIRSFDDVQQYVAKLNAKVYNLNDQKFWYDGYKGVKVNLNTHYGGSRVYNLADMLNLFGINNNTNDIYKAVYNTFGELQAKYYPEEKQLHPFMDYNKLVDKSILMNIMANHPELLEGKALIADYTNTITEQVASKSEQINFETGSDQISPQSYSLLNKMYTELLTSDGLKIRLVGHTDNVGNSTSNLNLSSRRANSVKQYLIEKGIPSIRIESEGRGDTEPLNSNSTQQEKAINRRVEIILGK